MSRDICQNLCIFFNLTMPVIVGSLLYFYAITLLYANEPAARFIFIKLRCVLKLFLYSHGNKSAEFSISVNAVVHSL